MLIIARNQHQNKATWWYSHKNYKNLSQGIIETCFLLISYCRDILFPQKIEKVKYSDNKHTHKKSKTKLKTTDQEDTQVC